MAKARAKSVVQPVGEIITWEFPETIPLLKMEAAIRAARVNTGPWSSPSGVTSLIHQMARNGGMDLVSIRGAGGAYFVIHSQRQLIEEIQLVLSFVDGTLRRFPVQEVSESLAECISIHLQKLVSGFVDSCGIISPASAPGVMKRRRQGIRQIHKKMETFRIPLMDYVENIESLVKEAEIHLEAARNGRMEPINFSAE